jgi:hypothetical protein
MSIILYQFRGYLQLSWGIVDISYFPLFPANKRKDFTNQGKLTLSKDLHWERVNGSDCTAGRKTFGWQSRE